MIKFIRFVKEKRVIVFLISIITVVFASIMMGIINLLSSTETIIQNFVNVLSCLTYIIFYSTIAIICYYFLYEPIVKFLKNHIISTLLSIVLGTCICLFFFKIIQSGIKSISLLNPANLVSALVQSIIDSIKLIIGMDFIEEAIASISAPNLTYWFNLISLPFMLLPAAETLLFLFAEDKIEEVKEQAIESNVPDNNVVTVEKRSPYIRCKNCGAILPRHIQFCNKCGKKI